MADAKQVQIRHDTDANLMGATPALAELGYNQTTKRLHLGDGVKAGGTIVPNSTDIQQNTFQWAAITGTGNAIVAVLTPAPASIAQPLSFKLKAIANNSGATTITVNGSSPYNIFKVSSSGPVALTGGEIVTGGIYDITFDGTRFLMIGASGGFDNVVSPGSFLIGHSGGLRASLGNSLAVYQKAIISDKSTFVLPYNGVVRVTFSLRRVGNATNATGRIYKNGTGIGTVRVNSTDTFVSFSENINVTQGDIIEIYILSSTGLGTSSAQIREFQISINEYLPSILFY